MKLNTCPECGHYSWVHGENGCGVGKRLDVLGDPLFPCPCKKTQEEATPKL